LQRKPRRLEAPQARVASWCATGRIVAAQTIVLWKNQKNRMPSMSALGQKRTFRPPDALYSTKWMSTLCLKADKGCGKRKPNLTIGGREFSIQRTFMCVRRQSESARYYWHPLPFQTESGWAIDTRLGALFDAQTRSNCWGDCVLIFLDSPGECVAIGHKTATAARECCTS